jgi:serine/threonine protein kinase
MGHVYRARDTKLNRDVALKVLPDAFAGDPDRLARFTREARTLASLNHPTSRTSTDWRSLVRCAPSSWRSSRGRCCRTGSRGAPFLWTRHCLSRNRLRTRSKRRTNRESDGQRFLIALTTDRPTDLAPTQMIVVQNWFED